MSGEIKQQPKNHPLKNMQNNLKSSPPKTKKTKETCQH